MYARLDELKAELHITSETDDAVLRSALQWATDEIERECRRKFVATTATREFDASAVDPDDPALLWLDDELLDVTTLTNGDGTTMATSTYVLWPRNETPHWGIRLKSSYSWSFTDSDSTISVAGTWGYSTTPPELVKGCCLRLATWRYQSRKLEATTTVFSESASVQTSKPPAFVDDVMGMLEPVKKAV